MGETISEFSGWDGRLAATIRVLFRQPGMLTREFLLGRRVRYVSPLRLYLLASLLYFLLAAAAQHVKVGHGEVSVAGVQAGLGRSDKGRAVPRPQRVGAASSWGLESGEDLSPAERDSALEDIARAPALMQPLLRRAVIDPTGFKAVIIETMPRMLFVLLPVFAGITALFYRGRNYPEHLYFAIHLQSFIFLALALTELGKFTRIPLLVMVVSAVAVSWIPVYATLAFRRAYGGSLLQTLVKGLGIAAIYCVAWVGAFIFTLYWLSIIG
jgi:hypothetical protein